ncbi:MAG: hypothetical protein J0H92_03570 [Sphingobacteriales bacterium]|nr:hypothetical protein [Sphingobacteriales bacterium]
MKRNVSENRRVCAIHLPQGRRLYQSSMIEQIEIALKKSRYGQRLVDGCKGRYKSLKV